MFPWSRACFVERHRGRRPRRQKDCYCKTGAQPDVGCNASILPPRGLHPTCNPSTDMSDHSLVTLRPLIHHCWRTAGSNTPVYVNRRVPVRTKEPAEFPRNQAAPCSLATSCSSELEARTVADVAAAEAQRTSKRRRNSCEEGRQGG